MNAFWRWYERYYAVNVGVSAVLFLLQLLHLTWLTLDVVATRLIGYSLFHPTGLLEFLIVVVDYIEIPTLLSVSLIYVNELRKKSSVKSWLYLLALNSQWFHIFWITDEIVEQAFTGSGSTVLPFWAAWIAILIDYLELPVIADTISRFLKAMKNREVKTFLQEK